LANDPDSYLSDGSNGHGQTGEFVPLAKQATQYPVTKVGFSPAALAARLQSSHSSSAGNEAYREIVATTSDCLRLYDLTGGSRSQQYSLRERSLCSNAKGEYTAPLTSFDWSKQDPTRIVTSSVDTTCTIWDINTSQAVTQLIAHDREVFDVAWSPNSRSVFASVGADGSARSFDLRQLDHSTILYESSSAAQNGGNTPGRQDGRSSGSGSGGNNNGTSQPQRSSARGSPLLRVAYNPVDANSLAIIHQDSSVITILDVRSPGLALAELRGHKAAVNGFAWAGASPAHSSSPSQQDPYSPHGHQHTTSSGSGGSAAGQENSMLASVGDDGQVLMWDLNNPNEGTSAGSVSRQSALPRQFGLPNAACSMPQEVNSIAWGGGRQYMAVGMGRTVRVLRL
jgi:WD repeat-containing protein 68